RKHRPAGLARIIGADLVAEFGERLSCHDAENPDGLVDLGRTPEHGYPVVVNRLVTESDLVVYVNAGHMRGFNGGWKSVCVGLSTYASIRVTHTPDGMSMSVHGNRMHAVLDEMGRHLESRLGRRIFKIDTLLADPFRVAQVVAGSVAEARRAIVSAMASMFPPRRDQASGRFADDYARRPDYVDAYRRHFGFHPVHAIFAVYPLKRLGHVGRVIVAAPRDPAIPRHVGFEVAGSVEEAVARAEKIHGADCAIA